MFRGQSLPPSLPLLPLSLPPSLSLSSLPLSLSLSLSLPPSLPLILYISWVISKNINEIIIATLCC